MSTTETAADATATAAHATSAGARSSGALRALTGARQAGITIALVLLVVIVGLLEPSYWTGANLLTILQQAAVTGILAVGVTFVIITAGIDLSFGSTVGLAAATFGMTLQADWPLVLAVLIALAVGVVAGLVNGVITTALRITPLIVTLGTLSIYAGLALLLTDGRTIFSLPAVLDITVNARIFGVPVSVLVLVLVTGVASFVLNRTIFGEYCIATGGNPEVARLAGIRTNLYVAGAYVLLGLLAGLAAVLTVGRLGAADPQTGADLLLPVIAASVIGGASLSGGEGSVVGAVIGAVFISALQAGLTILVIPAFYQQITVGVVIILAVALDKLQRGELRLPGRSRR